jgi:hypothetical protein
MAGLPFPEHLPAKWDYGAGDFGGPFCGQPTAAYDLDFAECGDVLGLKFIRLPCYLLDE